MDVCRPFQKGDEGDLAKIEEIKAGLEYLEDTLKKEGIGCDTHLFIDGRPAGEVVVDFAEKHGVDEIVVGTEKKSRVEKFILGSVAQYVVINARCPVVVV